MQPDKCRFVLRLLQISPGFISVLFNELKVAPRFCNCWGPEILTFEQATLYAPIISFLFVYLPSIFYVLIININIFGLKKFSEKFFESPLLFIFPLFTSFSFHKTIEEPVEEIPLSKNKPRANSMPIINSPRISRDGVSKMNIRFEGETKISNFCTGSLPSNSIISDRRNKKRGMIEMSTLMPRMKKSSSLPELRMPQSQEKTGRKKTSTKSIKSAQPIFSLFHSNILYILFLFGYFTCIGGDLIMQWAKNRFISKNTKIFVSIFIVNIFLWIDFNVTFSKKLKPQRRRKENVCEAFLQDSTHLAFCIIIAPIVLFTRWIRSGFILYLKGRCLLNQVIFIFRQVIFIFDVVFIFQVVFIFMIVFTFEVIFIFEAVFIF